MSLLLQNFLANIHLQLYIVSTQFSRYFCLLSNAFFFVFWLFLSVLFINKFKSTWTYIWITFHPSTPFTQPTSYAIFILTKKELFNLISTTFRFVEFLLRGDDVNKNVWMCDSLLNAINILWWAEKKNIKSTALKSFTMQTAMFGCEWM